ncbi:hypothetical protein DP117_09980 [Brasilonema sp. UFV-L1]|nr:hypothetical protein [Brasilonema sp. UFV-L1]
MSVFLSIWLIRNTTLSIQTIGIRVTNSLVNYQLSIISYQLSVISLKKNGLAPLGGAAQTPRYANSNSEFSIQKK